MPTRKIADLPGHKSEEVCLHPEHKVAPMQVFPPGIYEHTCPSCGKTYTFAVGVVSKLKSEIYYD